MIQLQPTPHHLTASSREHPVHGCHLDAFKNPHLCLCRCVQLSLLPPSTQIVTIGSQRGRRRIVSTMLNHETLCTAAQRCCAASGHRNGACRTDSTRWCPRGLDICVAENAPARSRSIHLLPMHHRGGGGRRRAGENPSVAAGSKRPSATSRELLSSDICLDATDGD